MNRFFRYLFLFLLIHSAITLATPNPGGVYIQHLEIDPGNPDVIYAGTMGAGLYKSVDQGRTWYPVTDTTIVKACQVVTLDPRDSSHLLMGGRATGVWESFDGGGTWTHHGLDSVTVCDMEMDPNNPDRLFVLGSDGVYRNNNIRKEDWDQVLDYNARLRALWEGPEPERWWSYSRFQKLAISPHTPQTIIIGARWEGGYHRSDDGGETWSHEWISGLFRRVDPILFHPEDPNRILVGTHHQGMFVTYNNGQSWVSMSRGLLPERRTPYYGAYLISGIVFDPTDTQTLYTGSDFSNFKTTNGGLLWQELDETLTCRFARTFAVDPKRPHIVYAGTNCGIYKSTDAGATWTGANQGFPAKEVKQRLTVTTGGSRYEFALTSGRPAVYRRSLSSDNSWTPVSWMIHEEGDNLVWKKKTNELILYAGEKTYTSTNAGLRWGTSHVPYTEIQSPVEEAPFEGDRDDPQMWTLDVTLQGKVFFTDSLVLPYYRRPPFVSIQVVSPDYPLDGSAPIWETNWDHYLKGTLQIPRDRLKDYDTVLLYLEVRDFQRNTLVGTAELDPEHHSQVAIPLSEHHVLPAMKYPTE